MAGAGAQGGWQRPAVPCRAKFWCHSSIHIPGALLGPGPCLGPLLSSVPLDTNPECAGIAGARERPDTRKPICLQLLKSHGGHPGPRGMRTRGTQWHGECIQPCPLPSTEEEAGPMRAAWCCPRKPQGPIRRKGGHFLLPLCPFCPSRVRPSPSAPRRTASRSQARAVCCVTLGGPWDLSAPV